MYNRTLMRTKKQKPNSQLALWSPIKPSLTGLSPEFKLFK